MISIIYAYRDRDSERIKVSLLSLNQQLSREFEVVFVDYGSTEDNSREIQNLILQFDFVRYFYLNVSHQLWNKSKALNYGVKKAAGHKIFIADVDLIFHPKTVNFLSTLYEEESFHLFPLGYLNEFESKKLYTEYKFSDLLPERFGKVNGMVLVSKKAMEEINGFDEFFHFYGAEDEDIFARLERAGYSKKLVETKKIFHNWHKSFSRTTDKELSENPRVRNIMRINQRHYQWNSANGVIKPFRQKGMGELLEFNRIDKLESPTLFIEIPNVLAKVEHFLREEIPSIENEVIQVQFFEDPYFLTLKHKVKNFIGTQTQPYCSMKEVNDMLLKEILFNYRNSNYSLKINAEDRIIIFCIER